MKRGQVALFVIVAIIIVAFLVGFAFYPKIKLYVSDVNPSGFLKDCVESELDKSLPLIAMRGGVYSPDNSLLYEDEKVQYLCYIDESYKPCIVQQPLLLKKFNEELSRVIEPKARACMSNLIQIYEQKGYNVKGGLGDVNVSIVPNSVKVEYLAPLEVSKEQVQTFRGFSVNRESEMYDLVLIATSIVQFESTLGDSETTLYLQYYPDLKIEKLKRDKDTIYTLTNVASQEKFRFATRSLIWPQGYSQ